MPEPSSFTRSPTRNARALSRTSPANRLPSVCCAASPAMMPVKAPPTAPLRVSSDLAAQRLSRTESGADGRAAGADRALVGAQARDPQCDRRDDEAPRQPDQEPDRAGGRGVHATKQRRAHQAPEVAD